MANVVAHTRTCDLLVTVVMRKFGGVVVVSSMWWRATAIAGAIPFSETMLFELQISGLRLPADPPHDGFRPGSAVIGECLFDDLVRISEGEAIAPNGMNIADIPATRQRTRAGVVINSARGKRPNVSIKGIGVVFGGGFKVRREASPKHRVPVGLGKPVHYRSKGLNFT